MAGELAGGPSALLQAPDNAPAVPGVVDLQRGRCCPGAPQITLRKYLPLPVARKYSPRRLSACTPILTQPPGSGVHVGAALLHFLRDGGGRSGCRRYARASPGASRRCTYGYNPFTTSMSVKCHQSHPPFCMGCPACHTRFSSHILSSYCCYHGGNHSPSTGAPQLRQYSCPDFPEGHGFQFLLAHHQLGEPVAVLERLAAAHWA